MRSLHELSPACFEAAPTLKLPHHANRMLAELSAVVTTTTKTTAIREAVKTQPQRKSVRIRDHDRFYSRHPCTARLNRRHPAPEVSATGCLRYPGDGTQRRTPNDTRKGPP
ncbi:hypothetical protein GCM10023307_09050 [Lysobacter hankyongensis]|uniref:Uncharacterized protein n=1 Tax=Lysobacter hankyongensis TaxID=1176535 RepID=A0ABP9AVC9_9GAMM